MVKALASLASATYVSTSNESSGGICDVCPGPIIAVEATAAPGFSVRKPRTRVHPARRCEDFLISVEFLRERARRQRLRHAGGRPLDARFRTANASFAAALR
jgi:hypothetical protein